MKKNTRLIEIKEKTGMTWPQFAEYFGVPYRTMQDWYLGNRKMPEYTLRLMIYKLQMERIIDSEEREKGE